mgnify:CR=1 FL=1
MAAQVHGRVGRVDVQAHSWPSERPACVDLQDGQQRVHGGALGAVCPGLKAGAVGARIVEPVAFGSEDGLHGARAFESAVA